MNTKQENADANELNQFAKLAHHWWDEAGELKTLHQINPTRLSYIQSKISLTNLNVLDVGCGGGILTESLAKAGGLTTGIDLNPSLIEVAKCHAKASALNIHYEVISTEAFAKTHPETYDVITCLEMLEHVPDPTAIIQACATLLKPGGHLFFSTLNRHPKSYLLAILGAEYLLKLIPKNTHDYAKFIKPSELHQWLSHENIKTLEIKGLSYNPLTASCKLTDDLSVNYLLHAMKIS